MPEKPKNYHEDCTLHIIHDNGICMGCEFKHYVEKMTKDITFNCEETEIK